MFLFVTITAVAGGWLMSPFVISKTFEGKLDYNCCALMTFDNIECLFLLRSF